MKILIGTIGLTLLQSILSIWVIADPVEPKPVVLSEEHQQQGFKVALFAGGCFWCLEPPYEKLDGVIEASVGYCGGEAKHAEYYQVSNGTTNHLETVRVIYNPEIVSYSQLLDIYWRFIDPTDSGGQYADRGEHYSTAIFYHDDMQKNEAERSKQALAASRKDPRPIVTKILAARPFYLAEPRHQNFYEKRYSNSKKQKEQ